MDKNYYDILGVKKDAKDADIKSAYRGLAKKYHPDKNPNDPGAEVKFKEINNAYDTLKDKTKRQEYDNPSPFGGMGGRQQGGGFGGFNSANMEDVFKDIFRHQHRARNQDATVAYAITLEDAYTGKIANLPLTFTSGETITLDLNIPKGIVSGNRMRFQGKGSTAVPDAPAGDIYVRVHVKDHPTFLRSGSDLLTEHEVSAIDAILGCSIKITTIDNKTLNVTVPAETQPNTRIRLQGKGMPLVHTKIYGDLYISIKVVTPTSITAEEKELLKQFNISYKSR